MRSILAYFLRNATRIKRQEKIQLTSIYKIRRQITALIGRTVLPEPVFYPIAKLTHLLSAQQDKKLLIRTNRIDMIIAHYFVKKIEKTDKILCRIRLYIV